MSLTGRSHMDPLVLLGVLAVIIGVIGVIVLLKGRKKRPH
jgi:LPXTG-motif cell wall-anchored protein